MAMSELDKLYKKYFEWQSKASQLENDKDDMIVKKYEQRKQQINNKLNEYHNKIIITKQLSILQNDLDNIKPLTKEEYLLKLNKLFINSFIQKDNISFYQILNLFLAYYSNVRQFPVGDNCHVYLQDFAKLDNNDLLNKAFEKALSDTIDKNRFDIATKPSISLNNNFTFAFRYFVYEHYLQFNDLSREDQTKEYIEKNWSMVEQRITNDWQNKNKDLINFYKFFEHSRQTKMFESKIK